MINDSEIDALIQPIVNLYSELERDLMIEVAKRFKGYDEVKGSLEWQLSKLAELGGVNKDLVEIIKKHSEKSEAEIKKMLESAGYANIDFDTINRAFALGECLVDADTLLNSEHIRQIIELSYKSLSDNFRMINTKALESARKSYMNILNTAYLDSATGIHSLQESCNKAVFQMAKKGIEGATYKRGNKYVTYSIEGVVRRDTLTAVHQLANKVSMESVNELGAEYVEISQHLGARVHPTNPIANHAGWQGKAFKINGSDEKYPNLKASTGYPDDIQGLGGVNCRHRLFLFFPGISIPNPIHYDEAENKRVYAATQHQRKLERELRKLKKMKACADACEDEETSRLLEFKINQKNDELDEWCEENNLRRDYSRELVSEQITSPVFASKYLNVSDESDIINIEPLSRYLNSSDKLYQNAQKVKAIDGYEDIFIHGDADGFSYKNANGEEIGYYSPREFARILRNDPSYNGGDIRLFSCSTASDGATAAQGLANQLGVNVLAPTKDIHIYPDGSFFIGSRADAKRQINTGEWVLLKPQRKE